jgi:hypothetical protein
MIGCGYDNVRITRGWETAKKRLGFGKCAQDGDCEGSIILDRLPSKAEAEEIRDISGGPQTFRGFGIKAGRQLKPILPASDAGIIIGPLRGEDRLFGATGLPSHGRVPIVIFKSGTVRRTGNRTFENCLISWVPTCPLGVSQATINADQKLIKKRSETDRPKLTPPMNPEPKMMFASSGPLRCAGRLGHPRVLAFRALRQARLRGSGLRLPLERRYRFRGCRSR